MPGYHPRVSSADVPPEQHSRSATALWGVAALLTFWSFGYTRMMGSDLWWHLAAGRLIWSQGSLPATDSWSFTAHAKPWLNHEWLSDVVFQAVAHAFGIERLVYWKWAVMIAAYGLLMATLRHVTRDPLASFAAATGALAVGAPFLDVRPHLYSLLGFALVLRLTLGAARPSPWLVPLFLVWVNLHGGFFFGLLVLGTIAGASLVAARLRPDVEAPSFARSCAILGACALACLCNPHGWHAFGYPLKYAFDATSPFLSLGEWLPPFHPRGIVAPAYVPAIGVVVLAALLALVTRLRRETPPLILGSALALAGLTLLMSLRSRRFITLFGMAGALLVAIVLQRATRRLSRHRWPAIVACLAGAGMLLPYPRSAAVFPLLTAEHRFPVDLCDYMDDAGIAGRVFAYYNWGGYLHLRTMGRLQVYIDGRADTVFDGPTYVRYLDVLKGRPGWEQVVEGSPAEYVLWPRELGETADALVARGSFRLLHEDSVSLLLARTGVPDPDPEPPARPTSWHLLTLAERALREERLDEAERHLAASLAKAPSMAPTCHRLAQVQAMRGRAADALATEQRCQGIFPDAESLTRLRAAIAQANEEP